MKEAKPILIYDSIHYVLKAEKILKKAGFKIKVVPVPREVSSDCGVCIRCEKQDTERILDTLGHKNCVPRGTYIPDSTGRYSEVG